MSLLSRIPFFRLRMPMVVAVFFLWQGLSFAVLPLKSGNWFGENQTEASRARETQEMEKRQAIVRQCLEEGKEKSEPPRYSHANYPVWHAVSPSDGLSPAAPLKWLADDVVMAFAWDDTKPEDAAYEGFVTLFAPPERFVGLVPTQDAREEFARAVLDNLRCEKPYWSSLYGTSYHSCWRKGRALVPQGARDALQVFAVAVIYDVPVFWFGQRLPRGGDAKEEARELRAGMSKQFQPLVEQFWLKHIRNEIRRAFTNPFLLLPALLIGWCFALECGFAFLWAVQLSAVWTFLSLCLDFSGFPVSVARPYLLAAGANSLVCLTAVLAAAFLRRRISGKKVLEARLRAREDALVARLERERESLKHEEGSPSHEFHNRRENKRIAYIRDRGRRNFGYLLLGLLLLGWLLHEGDRQQYWWENAFIRETEGISYLKEVVTRRVEGEH